MSTTPTTTSAGQLVDEVRTRGYRAELFPSDPPRTKVDAVNIWYHPRDRYPSDTAWAPYEKDGWVWGRNFEYEAPADASPTDLADRVLATLTPRD